MKTRKNYTGMWLAACIIFAAGCSNSLAQREWGEPEPLYPELGMGRVLIRIASLSQERTLFPSEMKVTHYGLSFVHEDGESIHDRSMEPGETFQIDLKTGEWTIIATGYTAGLEARMPIIRGSARITVSGGEPVIAEILLNTPLQEGDVTGTFSYRVEFPPELIDSAFLRLAVMGDDGAFIPHTTIDLQKSGEPGKSGDRIALPSGYYRMDIAFPPAYPYVGKTEIVHIYSGMETEAPAYRFMAEDFSLNGVDALAAYLEGLPDNTEDAPYPVRVRNINLSGSSATGNTLKTLYKALSRYVALDLRGGLGETVSNINDENKKKLVSLILPESVITINTKAFAGCTALVSVKLPGVMTIFHEAFSNCEKLESVDAPRLTRIANTTATVAGAFNNCGSLKSITLSGVTAIGRRSFYKCSALSVLSLPLVTEIEDEAFKYCGGLTKLSLPGVESIGDAAFSDCTNLAVVILGNAPPELKGSKVFSADKPLDGIYVPAASVSAYMGTAQAYWTEALKAKVKALAE